MDRSEPVELTNLIMIEDESGENVVIERRAKKDWPGCTFPGGHVERGESFVASAKREALEETGLEITDIRLCGLKQWTAVDERRYVVICFVAKACGGELRASDEGEVFWCRKSEIASLDLASGFDWTIDLCLGDATEEYHYKDGDEWKSKLL